VRLSPTCFLQVDYGQLLFLGLGAPEDIEVIAEVVASLLLDLVFGREVVFSSVFSEGTGQLFLWNRQYSFSQTVDPGFLFVVED